MSTSIIHKKKKITKHKIIKNNKLHQSNNNSNSTSNNNSVRNSINNSINKNNNDNESKKIILNEMSDLINIPEQQLRTAQLSYFSGSYFDKLYQEALEIEHKNDNNPEYKPLTPKDRSPLITKKKLNIASEKIGKISLNSRSKSKTPLKKKVKLIKKKSFKKKNNNSHTNNLTKVNISQSDIQNTPTKDIFNISSNNNTSLNFLTTNNNDNISNYMYSNSIYNRQNLYNSTNNYYINGSNNQNSITNFININNNININSNIGLISNNDIFFKKIIFSIKINTRFGEEIGVLGSIPSLGNWDVNKHLHLGWNTGNVWRGSLNNDDNSIQDFEFKFIILENGGVKLLGTWIK